MRVKGTLAAASIWMLGSALTGAPLGKVAGVVSTGGKPVAGAFVTITRELTLSRGEKAPEDWKSYSAVARTGKDGSYSFDGVPIGAYSLCAQAAGTELVNMCQWGVGAVAVNVTSAKETGAPLLNMAAGHRVRIRVEDPKRLLKGQLTELARQSLVAGVWGPGNFFHPAPLVSMDKGGRDFEILAPFDVVLRVGVSSTDLTFNDAEGRELSTVGGMKDATLLSGSASKVHRFSVTGLKGK